MKKNWLVLVFICASVFAIVNILFIDWFRVPSNSMAPTLTNNCILLTSKNTRKGSIAGTLIPLDIKKQDIVVFVKPEWKPVATDNKIYVKRCVGVPGDTVVIKHHRPQRKVEVIPGQESVMYLFPQDTLFKNWTLTDYGPFRVPAKGLSIQLTDYNIRLYRKLIQFENKSIVFIENKAFLDGKPLAMFTFQHNYYFMVGDNFLMSEDSRAWGCVPEENLLGKVLWHS